MNKLITWPRVRRLLLNESMQKMRRLRRIASGLAEYRQRKALAPTHVSNIEANGCAHIQSGRTDSLLEHALERFNSMSESDMVVQENKKFYLNCINQDDYEPSSTFMQYALEESTLRTVGAYLGFAPYLQSIELIFSKPTGEALNRTHHFHRDLVDRRIVKIFTYITDVDEDCGPLTVLPLPVMNAAPWPVRTMPGFLPDEELSPYVDLSKAVQHVGPAGTAFAADTKRLLHMGSRCKRSRLTFVAHYNSGFGYYPRYPYHRWSPDDYDLTELQRMAVGG